MAASTVIKHFTDGTVKFEDGTGTPVSLTVPADQGDLSISGLAKGNREAVPYQSRGTLHSLRQGARTFPTGSLSIMLADISDATDGTVPDFVLRQGSYSANTSTTTGDAYTIDIELTIEGTDFGDTADHTIKLSDCHCTLDIAEGSPDTITINFTVYGSIAMT
jgi:hypothetical protein